MITASRYFERHADSPEITDQVRKNADKLIGLVSTLLSLIPFENPVITSGFRTKKQNEKVKGAVNSAHMTGEAIDLYDPDKVIGLWCQTNVGYLRANGLHMESLATTHKSHIPEQRWVHLTTRAPRSGNTIYFP
jgi:hypothetical protein